MPYTKIFKALLGVIFMTLGSCSNPSASQDQASTFVPQDNFSMLKHLTKIKKPLTLYQQAYPAFAFTSQAKMKNAPAQRTPFQATTDLRFSAPNNMSINRQPFPPIEPVELIKHHGLIYIRTGQDKTFYQIKNNLELENLKMTILQEVLTPFASPEIKASAPTTQGNLICHSATHLSICFDPETKLPIEGTLNNVSDFQSITFRFDTQNPSIKILPPKNIHHLRNHAQL